MKNNIIPLHSSAYPTLYDQAIHALAECCSIDECKNWSDRAAAIAEYARRTEQKELLKLAYQLHVRSAERIGQLLGQVEPSKGGRPPETRDGAVPSLTRKQAATDAGLSERQAKEALRVASVPKERLDELVDQGAPVSVVAREGTKTKPKPLVDLEGIPPKQFNKGILLFGFVEQAHRDLDELGDPVYAFFGLKTYEHGPFHRQLESLIQRLEVLKNAVDQSVFGR